MALNGIDVASYQTGMNVGTVAGDFVIVKATGGTGYVNPSCNTHVEQTLKADKKLGLYHFAHESGCQGTAEQEAQFFINSIKNYIGKAMLILDFESDNQTDTAWAKRWLDYVYAKTGIRPVLYISLSNENNANWSNLANDNYGLWIAQYNNYNIVNGFKPRDLYGNLKHFKSMAMFQYTSTGRLDGWGGNLDFDVFYGDKATWDKYATSTGTPKPQPKPTPAPKPSASKTWVDALGVKWTKEDGTFTPKGAVNLRWGTSTSSSVITTLQPGNTVKYDAKCVSGGYIWVRQPRSNGYGYCAVGKADSAGRNVDPYGTFK
ncbi:GH25 family lysozyme [Latilactobacillus sakei]|uniref:GH25 family lysozyme n=1 Tax=Latilactobacillus sakei TaxID=1599 RepID=UPI000DC648F4|nr:GH25 family lysozyme [Latilactobacillus sakei]SPS04244.1 Glycosyl hydrolases family 25 [Latilactobacillus sakei]